MAEVHKLLTIHSPFAPIIDETLFDTIEEKMSEKGITKWWVSPESLPDVVIMMEIPDDIIEAARGRQR